jgi:hypothetical protein
MRVEEEPELLKHRPEAAEGQVVFGSAWFLQSDLAFTRDAYLSPLLLSLSPWVWAIAGARVPGVIIYDFGTAIIGRTGAASELLQVFLPAGPPTSPPRPDIGSAETAAALTWWVGQLNQVLGELTDPVNFKDRDGNYRPRRQFEVLLTVEQLGRRLQSVLATDRDTGARRLLSFSALDTLQGLGAVTFDDACRLSRAEKALQTVEQELPSTAAGMLLPTARRAVEGLRGCQEGFFLSSRIGSNGVRIPDKRGGDRTVALEDGVAGYLRVLRNASHGFTGQNDAGRRRDEILLMAHNGNVPADLGLLPYLYWLELLANPARLRRWLLRHRRDAT